jgi:hypothetical protein
MIALLKDIFRDLTDQAWTFLGMFVAWLVLDGSARTMTGYAIGATTVFWIITYPIRNPKEDDSANAD